MCRASPVFLFLLAVFLSLPGEVEFGPVPGHAVPVGSSRDVIENARLGLWQEQVESVLDSLTPRCQTHMRKIVTNRSPQDACHRLRKNMRILKFTCKNAEISQVEGVACGFSNVIVPTFNPDKLPSDSSSSPLLPSGGDPSASTTDEDKKEESAPDVTTTQPTPPKTTTTTTLTTAMTTTVKPEESSEQNTNPPAATPLSVSENTEDNSSFRPSLKPSAMSERGKPSKIPSSATSDLGPTLTASSMSVNPGSKKTPGSVRTGLLTRDSRLSHACNRHLPLLSCFLSHDKDRSGQRCRTFYLLVQDVRITHDDTDIAFPNTELLRAACSQDEQFILHEMLCSDRNREPAHALRGQQQEDVRYVIKTGVSSSCRAALWPLGEGHVAEEAQDSCRTLAGPEGDQLVSSRVCTRQDLDTVLEAVCDAATTTSGHLIALFSALVSLIRWARGVN